jgi:hypothetical protein
LEELSKIGVHLTGDNWFFTDDSTKGRSLMLKELLPHTGGADCPPVGEVGRWEPTPTCVTVGVIATETTHVLCCRDWNLAASTAAPSDHLLHHLLPITEIK